MDNIFDYAALGWGVILTFGYFTDVRVFIWGGLVGVIVNLAFAAWWDERG